MAPPPTTYTVLPRWFQGRTALGLVIPIATLLILGAFHWTQQPAVFLTFPLLYYVLIPLEDLLLGRDNMNLSAALREALEAAPYYRILLYITGMLYVVCIAATLITLGLSIGQMHWIWLLVLALGAALFNGAMILVAHELGHGHTQVDRRIARALLMIIGYGHYTLEHNAGHHVRVCTPADPASARYGETLYAFALREIPGAVRSAVMLELRRLKGKGFWHRNNHLLTSWVGTLIIALPFVLVFGFAILPLLLLHHLGCWFMLTKANYVEHYGLGRRQLENGKFERVRPCHSWNSDYWLTNALSFNLQRHSDHHANASREYQILETHDNLPQLPAGYPGSFFLAMIPPLWFWVMNPRVQAWAKENDAVINHG